MSPLISIIIPVYNKKNCISQTLLSILQQINHYFEIIIINDGSTDNSYDIIKEIKQAEKNGNKIKLFSQQNGGPSKARNYGVRNASGDWIVFLDADDSFEPDALNYIHDNIKKHPECNFFCYNHYVKENGKKKLYSDKYIEGYLRNNFYSWCIGHNMPRAGAAVFKKELLQKHPFNEKLRRYEDAESLFEIMREERIYQIPIPIMTYNRGSASASLPRTDISEDFMGHLQPKGKGWWEQYALYQLYLQTCYVYPKESKFLYRIEDFWTFRIKILNRILKLKQKLNL